MNDDVGTQASGLLRSLAEATRANPFGRKLLVCEWPAEGRELLRTLALSGTPWLGWESVSARQLALHLVGETLAAEGLTTADAFDMVALVDAAIDDAMEAAGAGPFGREVPPAYREPIRRAVETLREGGVSPDGLRRSPDPDGRLAFLARLLERVESGLARASLVDGAGLLGRAAARLEGESREGVLSDTQVFLLPGLGARGVAGRLMRALESIGASTLAADSPAGIEPPPGTVWASRAEREGPPTEPVLFAAATPADEIREVLRRLVYAGVAWDQVEIVAMDGDVYGVAMDGLARRLGIPVTYAAGLDARRTRVGRVAEAYFEWVMDGYPADVIRRLLETGDVAPREPADAGAEARRPSGPALARRLRRLRVGWGYDRYLEAVDRARAALEGESDPDDDGRDEFEVQRAELETLRDLLAPVLAATPRLDGRHAVEFARTSPARLAEGLLALLEFVPRGDAVEAAVRAVLVDRLRRARETLSRSTGWRAATAMLRARLQTRVSAASESGRAAPWTSTAGALHLSTVSSGGLSGRSHTFVVGLAAGALPGAAVDPLLGDRERAAVGLPTSAERLAVERHALAAMLARLRGRVTLSYAAWDMSEGRVVAPAPEMLHALRVREGDDALTYDDLRRHLGALAGAVPSAGLLDDTDVWLRAIAAPDGSLRDGTAAVRVLHPSLNAGLTAAEARVSDTFSAWNGRVDAAESLDPRAGGDVFSASGLETLGACPLQFFYKYVLGIRYVRDPEYDPESWLDALERGSLLHAVFERTVGHDGSVFDAGVERWADARLEERAMRVLGEEVERVLHRLPAPNEAVLRAEVEALEADVGSFVSMLRSNRPRVLRTELAFGPRSDAGSEGEVELEIGGGGLQVRGRVDRLDALDAGGLRIVDYKTGRADRYSVGVPFAGGRRLQHLLYSLAVERLRPDESVRVMEYQFPTVKGENEVRAYPRAMLEEGRDVLEILLDLAASGRFLPTFHDGDCKYCDYAAVCRVAVDDWGSVTSPRAAWAAETGRLLPEYAPLVRLREEFGDGR